MVAFADLPLLPLTKNIKFNPYREVYLRSISCKPFFLSTNTFPQNKEKSVTWHKQSRHVNKDQSGLIDLLTNITDFHAPLRVYSNFLGFADLDAPINLSNIPNLPAL